MKNQVLALLVLMSVFLTACSGLSKTECAQADWEQLGFDDGNKGIGINASSYIESCSKHSVELDMSSYREGHERGARLFCQPENGFELGKQGYKYSVVCPSNLSSAFTYEYEIGYEFFIVNYNINQIETTLNTNASTISKLHRGISSGYTQLDDPNLTYAQQNAIRQNIDSMTGQIETYELSTERLEPILRQQLEVLQRLKERYDR